MGGRKMKTIIFIALTLIFITTSASAEMTVKKYLTVKNEKETKIYVTGLGDGMNTLNDLLKMTRRNLYCVPSNLVLTTDNYQNILDTMIGKLNEKGALKDDFTIDLILAWGMVDAFLCKK